MISILNVSIPLYESVKLGQKILQLVPDQYSTYFLTPTQKNYLYLFQFISIAEDGKPNSPAYLAKYREMVSLVEMAAQSRLWIGKDYNNFVLKDLTNLNDPFEGEESPNLLRFQFRVESFSNLTVRCSVGCIKFLSFFKKDMAQ